MVQGMGRARIVSGVSPYDGPRQFFENSLVPDKQRLADLRQRGVHSSWLTCSHRELRVSLRLTPWKDSRERSKIAANSCKTANCFATGQGQRIAIGGAGQGEEP